MFALSALVPDLLAALREMPPPHLRELESESGLGTARALTSILDQLSAQQGGAPLSPAEQQRVFALALRQVDSQGRSVNQQLNKPDISFIGAGPDGAARRVNIEIETQDLRRHVTAVNRDPNAHNVFLKIDPWTGAVLGGIERAPGGKERPLSAAQAQAALTQLPKPQQDPTLTVDPRSGKQKRTKPKPTPARASSGAARTAKPAPRTTRPSAPARGRARGRGAREFEGFFEFESELGRAADEMES